MEPGDQGSVGSDGSDGSATASLKSIEEELDSSFEKVLDGLSGEEEKKDTGAVTVEEVVINAAARPRSEGDGDDEVAFLLSGDGEEEGDDDSDSSAASSDAPSETLETVKLAQEELDRRFTEESQLLSEEGGDSQARIMASNLMDYSSTYSSLYKDDGIEELQDDLSAASVVDEEQEEDAKNISSESALATVKQAHDEADRRLEHESKSLFEEEKPKRGRIATKLLEYSSMYQSLYGNQGLDSLQADLAMADMGDGNDQAEPMSRDDERVSSDEEPVFLGNLDDTASHPQHHQMQRSEPEFAEGGSHSEMPRAAVGESTNNSDSDFLVDHHDLSTASSSDLHENLLRVEQQLNRRLGSFLADKSSEEMDLDGGEGNSDLDTSHNSDFSAILRDSTDDNDSHQQQQPPNLSSFLNSTRDSAASTPGRETDDSTHNNTVLQSIDEEDEENAGVVAIQEAPAYNNDLSTPARPTDAPQDGQTFVSRSSWGYKTDTPGGETPPIAARTNSVNRYCHSSWKNSLRSQLMEHEEEDDDDEEPNHQHSAETEEGAAAAETEKDQMQQVRSAQHVQPEAPASPPKQQRQLQPPPGMDVAAAAAAVRAMSDVGSSAPSTPRNSSMDVAAAAAAVRAMSDIGNSAPSTPRNSVVGRTNMILREDHKLMLVDSAPNTPRHSVSSPPGRSVSVAVQHTLQKAERELNASLDFLGNASPAPSRSPSVTGMDRSNSAILSQGNFLMTGEDVDLSDLQKDLLSAENDFMQQDDGDMIFLGEDSDGQIFPLEEEDDEEMDEEMGGVGNDGESFAEQKRRLEQEQAVYKEEALRNARASMSSVSRDDENDRPAKIARHVETGRDAPEENQEQANLATAPESGPKAEKDDGPTEVARQVETSQDVPEETGTPALVAAAPESALPAQEVPLSDEENDGRTDVGENRTPALLATAPESALLAEEGRLQAEEDDRPTEVARHVETSRDAPEENQTQALLATGAAAALLAEGVRLQVEEDRPTEVARHVETSPRLNDEVRLQVEEDDGPAEVEENQMSALLATGPESALLAEETRLQVEKDQPTEVARQAETSRDTPENSKTPGLLATGPEALLAEEVRLKVEKDDRPTEVARHEETSRDAPVENLTSGLASGPDASRLDEEVRIQVEEDDQLARHGETSPRPDEEVGLQVEEDDRPAEVEENQMSALLATGPAAALLAGGVRLQVEEDDRPTEVARHVDTSPRLEDEAQLQVEENDGPAEVQENQTPALLATAPESALLAEDVPLPVEEDDRPTEAARHEETSRDASMENLTSGLLPTGPDTARLDEEVRIQVEEDDRLARHVKTSPRPEEVGLQVEEDDRPAEVEDTQMSALLATGPFAEGVRLQVEEDDHPTEVARHVDISPRLEDEAQLQVEVDDGPAEVQENQIPLLATTPESALLAAEARLQVEEDDRTTEVARHEETSRDATVENLTSDLLPTGPDAARLDEEARIQVEVDDRPTEVARHVKTSPRPEEARLQVEEDDRPAEVEDTLMSALAPTGAAVALVAEEVRLQVAEDGLPASPRLHDEARLQVEVDGRPVEVEENQTQALLATAPESAFLAEEVRLQVEEDRQTEVARQAETSQDTPDDNQTPGLLATGPEALLAEEVRLPVEEDDRPTEVARHEETSRDAFEPDADEEVPRQLKEDDRPAEVARHAEKSRDAPETNQMPAILATGQAAARLDEEVRIQVEEEDLPTKAAKSHYAPEANQMPALLATGPEAARLDEEFRLQVEEEASAAHGQSTGGSNDDEDTVLAVTPTTSSEDPEKEVPLPMDEESYSGGHSSTSESEVSPRSVLDAPEALSAVGDGQLTPDLGLGGAAASDPGSLLGTTLRNSPKMSSTRSWHFVQPMDTIPERSSNRQEQRASTVVASLQPHFVQPMEAKSKEGTVASTASRKMAFSPAVVAVMGEDGEKRRQEGVGRSAQRAVRERRKRRRLGIVGLLLLLLLAVAGYCYYYYGHCTFHVESMLFSSAEDGNQGDGRNSAVALSKYSYDRAKSAGIAFTVVCPDPPARASLPAAKHRNIARKGRLRRNTRMLVVRRDSEDKASAVPDSNSKEAVELEHVPEQAESPSAFVGENERQGHDEEAVATVTADHLAQPASIGADENGIVVARPNFVTPRKRKLRRNTRMLAIDRRSEIQTRLELAASQAQDDTDSAALDGWDFEDEGKALEVWKSTRVETTATNETNGPRLWGIGRDLDGDSTPLRMKKRRVGNRVRRTHSRIHNKIKKRWSLWGIF